MKCPICNAEIENQNDLPENVRLIAAAPALLAACKALIRCKDNDLSGTEFIHALVGIEFVVRKVEGR